MDYENEMFSTTYHDSVVHEMFSKGHVSNNSYAKIICCFFRAL